MAESDRPHANPTAVATGRGDRVIYWPLVIVLLVSGTLVACAASPIGSDFAYVVLGIPLLLVLLIIAAVPASFIGLTAAREGAWRKALSYGILPAVVLANVWGPLAYTRACLTVGDLINLAIMYDDYRIVINALPNNGQPKLLVFNRGGMIWASSGVVYDESDEIALPPEKQSQGWIARARNTELSCSNYSITSVVGHFYLASFPC